MIVSNTKVLKLFILDPCECQYGWLDKISSRNIAPLMPIRVPIEEKRHFYGVMRLQYESFDTK